MKISNKLPQFVDTKAMLLVCSTSVVDVYEARDGEIEKIFAYEREEPLKRDGEKNLDMGATGVVWGLDEKDRRVELQEFKRDLKPQFDSLKDIDTYDEVYLFAPDYAAPHIEEVMPSILRERIAARFEGNYTRSEPFEFLELIKEAIMPPEPKPEDPEALKILKNSEQARHVIKGKPEEDKWE